MARLSAVFSYFDDFVGPALETPEMVDLRPVSRCHCFLITRSFLLGRPLSTRTWEGHLTRFFQTQTEIGPAVSAGTSFGGQQ